MSAPGGARLVEVFASLQGEGRRVGERQVFVRFATCDRKCLYCDTPESIGGAPPTWRLGTAPGEEVANPVSVAELTAHVEALCAGLPRPVISVTGGEPLLQAPFIARWFAELPARFEVVLETHGLLARPLAKLLPRLAEVVMDVKLPSATGEPAGWARHHEVLAACREAGVPVTLKAVVAATTEEDELAEVGRLFEAAGPEACPVLQPVTPYPGGPPAPTLDQLMDWQRRLTRGDVSPRVVPQVHRLLEIP